MRSFVSDFVGKGEMICIGGFKTSCTHFFFFLTCCGLTAHRVGAPASAKKWSWRQIGISFQLLLFTDLFKDKTMTQQWFCAYMENTPAFLQKEGL